LKNKILKKIAAATLTATISLSAAATLMAEEKAVTLPELVAITLQNNGELKALREEIEIFNANKIKAGIYPNPTLELEGENGARNYNNKDNRASIGIGQELLTGGKRAKRLAVAEQGLQGFNLRIIDAERRLLLELKTGYYDFVLARNRVDLARKSAELNNKLLDIAKVRFAAGEIAELDVNLARLEAARSEGKKREAEADSARMRERMLSLTGVSMEEQFAVADSFSLKPVTKTSEDLKALALQNRPDLMALYAENQKSEAEIALAKAERIPNVTSGLAFIREKKTVPTGGTDERDTDYFVGLKLSVPIPIFDRNQAGLQEASAKKAGAEHRHRFLLRNIEREVAGAHERFVASEKTVLLFQEGILPQLNENLKLVQKSYRLGEVGILAGIEEQKKFAEVNDDYLITLRARNTALAELEAAVGVELGESDGGNK